MIVTGMRLEIEFDRELTERECSALTAAGPGNALPIDTVVGGMGLTRPLAITVRGDRHAILIEMDTGDLAPWPELGESPRLILPDD